MAKKVVRGTLQFLFEIRAPLTLGKVLKELSERQQQVGGVSRLCKWCNFPNKLVDSFGNTKLWWHLRTAAPLTRDFIQTDGEKELATPVSLALRVYKPAMHHSTTSFEH